MAALILMVPVRQSSFRNCAARYYADLSQGIGTAPRQLLLRRRIVHGSCNRRGVSSWRFGSYGDWRQSYWPYWGWDVAASLLATAPAYDSYYYGVGYGDEVPADAGAVAYCVQRFRSYDRASGTYLGRDGYRHPCP